MPNQKKLINAAVALYLVASTLSGFIVYDCCKQLRSKATIVTVANVNYKLKQ
jgi:hypothetical protein